MDSGGDALFWPPGGAPLRLSHHSEWGFFSLFKGSNVTVLLAGVLHHLTPLLSVGAGLASPDSTLVSDLVGVRWFPLLSLLCRYSCVVLRPSVFPHFCSDSASVSDTRLCFRDAVFVKLPSSSEDQTVNAFFVLGGTFTHPFLYIYL